MADLLTPDPRLDDPPPTTVGVCMECGMIETLRAAVEAAGKLPTDHTCDFTTMPVVPALQLAAMLEADRKQRILPRCADCGSIPVEIYSFSEEKGRCKPCAKLNWRAIWRESVDGLIEDEQDTPLEEILRTRGSLVVPKREFKSDDDRWYVDTTERKRPRG